MSQSRVQSCLETVANVTIGYVVAIAAQVAIFPLFGVYVAFSRDLAIGAMFTVISLVRSYALRRAFNYLHSRSA